jgi:hypothetical protein
LHTRRVFTSRHEGLPGVHTHGAQTPAEQVVLAPQTVSVNARPSALQARRTLVPGRQVEVPGVQSQPLHMPVAAVQLAPPPQETVAEYPRPSALQTRVPVVPTHSGVPGTQTRGRQTPALQVSLAAQGIAVQASPSVAQTSRAVRLPITQRAAPGAHTRSTHAPPEQLWVGPQGSAA